MQTKSTPVGQPHDQRWEGGLFVLQQGFAHHWGAAGCGGRKPAAAQCPLSCGSSPGTGGQCGTGSPPRCCAGTGVQWRSWAERLAAQGCSTWKKNFRSNKTHGWRNGHTGATLGISANTSTWVGGMRDEAIPVPVLWYRKHLLGYYTPTGWLPLQEYLRLLWCYSLKGCISILYCWKQRLPFKRFSF